MAAPQRTPESTISVTPTVPPPPPPPNPPPIDPAIAELNTVLELSSLNSHAGQPARLTNLSQANVIANTNRSVQNALANQQAHAQLTISVLGKAVNKVQNLGPLEARSSVAALTDNATADEIAALKAAIEGFIEPGPGPGPGPGPRPGPLPHNWAWLIKALWRLLREIEHIEKVNARLTGTGTESDPYTISEGPLYSAAPITHGFPGWLPTQVNFQIDDRHLNISA